MSRYYPKRRAPKLPPQPEEQHETWEKVHSELAELMFMLHFTRSKDQFIKVSYGGTLDQLERMCRKISNIISSYKETRND